MARWSTLEEGRINRSQKWNGVFGEGEKKEVQRRRLLMHTKGYPIDSAQSERITGQGEQLLEDLDVQHDEIGGDSDVVTALPQTPLCVT